MRMTMTVSACPVMLGPYRTLAAFEAGLEECAGWLSMDYRGGGGLGLGRERSRGYEGLALIEAADPEAWIRSVPDGRRCSAELSLNAGVAIELKSTRYMGLFPFTCHLSRQSRCRFDPHFAPTRG